MHLSESFLNTLRQVPKEAKVPSHQLMIKAGLIRQLGSGLYTYLPFGWKVIKKIMAIITEEMDKAGAQEVSLPILQPSSLWEKSGRWKEYGDEMMRVKDRRGNLLGIGPTHEEIITDLVAKEIKSYRQLPIILYQIKSKFRDEIRPRFGIIRSREFIMKDAYSFDIDSEGLEKTYQVMYQTYERIFSRCKLSFEVVEADPGLIGGRFSHEFIALCENGEDTIVTCSHCSYKANLEMAECRRPQKRKNERKEKEQPLKELHTPGITTTQELQDFLKIPTSRMIKTLIFQTEKGFIAALIRGDHEVNLTKLRNIAQCSKMEMASPTQIQKLTNAPVGFSGPINLKGVTFIQDLAITEGENFICGANKEDTHLKGVSPGKNFFVDMIEDIRYITENEPCPKCKGKIILTKGIELGHIFKLGTKYSIPLQAKFIDKDNKEKPMIMGCYGIGIDRIVAASIEQNHDGSGIIFPLPLAPYHILVLPVNYADKVLGEKSEGLYNRLKAHGFEVLIDDRDEPPGVKFNDAHLLGIPILIVLGKNFINHGFIELHYQRGEKQQLKEEEIFSYLSKHLEKN